MRTIGPVIQTPIMLKSIVLSAAVVWAMLPCKRHNQDKYEKFGRHSFRVYVPRFKFDPFIDDPRIVVWERNDPGYFRTGQVITLEATGSMAVSFRFIK